jgi:pilus assembly protein CpaE
MYSLGRSDRESVFITPGGIVPAARILLVDTDTAASSQILDVLNGIGYTVTAISKAQDALAHVAEHQLVILDVVTGPKSAAELCAEIRAMPTATPVPLLCVSQTDEVEERIKLLEAGADDVVAKPVDGRELEARVEALLLRFQRSRDPAPASSGDGVVMTAPRRIVTVFSPKGGVGTTLIATNIAVVAAGKRPERVVLVDLDLQFGGVAPQLDIEPKQTLADVTRDSTAMKAAELLRGYAVKHGTGLHVLCAPPTPELSELVTPEVVKNLLATLTSGYDHVIIDAGSVLDERTMLALEAADTVVIPVYPEIPALKSVHTLLDFLSDQGTLGTKTTVFVLNNAFARDILKQRDIESALGTKIAYDLPYDPFLYLKSVNEGVPIVLGAAESLPALKLVKLAGTVFGEDGSAVPAEPQRRGLFGALRRRT